MQTIQELVRESEQDYINGTTTISKYVEFNQYENINKIDAYVNSKHTSGEFDSLGREKPFFNIVTAAENIWYRATDIDRRNIQIKSTKIANYVATFLANIVAQKWMMKSMFGHFLNEWGRNLARYGSSVIKFVEKGGELYKEVIPWSRIICDAIDFDSNPKIEVLYLTQSQLRKNKSYDQEIVKNLIDSVTSRETLDGQKKDNIDKFIKLYEVHGELPLSFLTGKEEDQEEYVQQMQVISFVEKKSKKGGNTEYEDFTLVKGREEKDPYMITHLIKEDGRTQAIGAVEHLFNAQWMVNHTAKQIKDQLDLASKIIYQTSDGNYVGRNALTSIQNGTILIHEVNQPLTQLNNNSHDITSLQNFSTQWMNLAKEITSTPDAISGNTMPSGTAYRQVAILNQESHSLFELMTENKGLHIEEMFRKYIFPYIKKQLKNSDEIVAELDSHGIKQIDMMFVPNKAIKQSNDKIKELVLGGEMVTPEQQAQDIASQASAIKQTLAQYENKRFIKPSEIEQTTWDEIFKDVEWEAEVETTGEQSDKNAILTTLSTTLQTLATNPMVLQNPEMKVLFNKILEIAGGISPLEIAQSEQQSVQQSFPQINGGSVADMTKLTTQ